MCAHACSGVRTACSRGKDTHLPLVPPPQLCCRVFLLHFGPGAGPGRQSACVLCILSSSQVGQIGIVPRSCPHLPAGGVEVKGKGRMDTFIWSPEDEDEGNIPAEVAAAVAHAKVQL